MLTSATIPPRIVERVGLEAFPTEELNVGSPFDYRSHALLYVARHLPDRRAAGAEEALHEELALLLEAAGGRTLALFTSQRATEAAADGAGDRSSPTRCCCRAIFPKSRLLEQFAADETSCLFATMGFWQGVDIPGRALSLVTIDKLPSRVPTTRCSRPRRDRAGGRAFSLVDLPRAATLLAQGVGPAHPQRGRPGRRRRARPAAGHGVVPRRAAGDAAPDAAVGRHPRGGVVPAPVAGRSS